jgi:hypothetical protein
VIAHQDVRVDPPAQNIHDSTNQVKKVSAIDRVAKNLALFVAAAGYMPERASVIQP